MHFPNARQVVDRLRKTMRPEQVLALGFAVLILLGASVLSLPIASADGKSIGIFEGLFTATSAVCVTGLVVVDTGTAFSLFGQIVILLLLQIGGLGFMVLATLVMVMLGRRITLWDRILIRESMNTSTLSGMVRLSMWYGALALLFELAGALVLSIRFIPMYGLGKGIYFSLFHAVSAFCNAGFDLFGNYQSITNFSSDPLVVLTISTLIITGGMGFAVLFEVIKNRKDLSALTLHAKLVMTITAGLLVSGTIFFLLVEWQNPATLASGMTVPEKVLNSWFQSVTLRTAGFNTIDQASMTQTSKLMSVILMFIGASPASTGGGVKTTTMSVLLLIVINTISGHEDVNVFGKRLPQDLLRRALAILFISLMILIVGTMALTLTESGNGYNFIDLLFEAASAFGTVGVSAIGTPNLVGMSRAVLILMMYFGRVGPLTIAMAIRAKQGNTANHLHYPEGRIMIG